MPWPVGPEGTPHRRLDPLHHQQPDRLHHQSALLAIVALPVGCGEDDRGADLPRQRRRSGSGGACGEDRHGVPAEVPEACRHRHVLLPALRPQRRRRTPFHPAALVPEDRRPSRRARTLSPTAASARGPLRRDASRTARRIPLHAPDQARIHPRGEIAAETTTIKNIDLAEKYPTKDTTLVAGELVMLDQENPVFVSRYDRAAASSTLIGVISTKPGVLLGGFGNELYPDDHKVPVTLSGRVPVKVNLEGGPISIGDLIAPSSVAGVGARATTTGMTIGVALESLSATSTESSVLVFVNRQFYFGPNDLAIDKTSGNLVMALSPEARVGIGTTTPQYKLHVAGDVAANSFINVSTRGAKKDIEYLGEEGGADVIEKIRGLGVAKYRYSYEDSSAPLRLGLIAEESPSEVLSADGKGVDLYKLSTFVLTGIKELDKRLVGIETRLADLESLVGTGEGAAASGSAGSGGVLGLLESLGAKFTNGLASLKAVVAEAFTVGSREKPSGITLYDEDRGEPYCLRIKSGAMVSTPGECTAGSQTSTSSGSLTSAAPVITINGNNPAEVAVGAAYVDLGALVTDDKDQNLGIHAFVNGFLVGEMGNISIDTSTTTTHAIDYVATDNDGNTATSTRTVIVGEPDTNPPIETNDTNNTDTGETATSTPPVIETPAPVDTATTTPPVSESQPAPEPEPDVTTADGGDTATTTSSQ